MHAGVYVLQRGLESIQLDADNTRFEAVTCSIGQRLTASALVCAPEYLSQYAEEEDPRRATSRCVCVTDRSLFDTEEHASLIIPPTKDHSTIEVLQMGAATSTCPDGQFVVYFSTEARADSPDLDLSMAVHEILTTGDSECHAENVKPIVLWGTFFREAPPVVEPDRLPAGVHVCPSIRSTLRDAEAHVTAAREIFARICPDATFLPQQAEPEEEIWDDGPIEELEQLSGEAMSGRVHEFNMQHSAIYRSQHPQQPEQGEEAAAGCEAEGVDSAAATMGDEEQGETKDGKDEDAA